MNATKLAKLLVETPDASVEIWNPDADNYVPVTGMIVSQDGTRIRLQSDDID